MSDSYQAIYDAVRSRISGGNIADAVQRVAYEAFDISHMKALMQEQFLCAAYEMQRPSAIYRPAIYPDGGLWCALYGKDLQEGVCGFGATPAEAMADFDQNWLKQRCGAAAKPAA